MKIDLQTISTFSAKIIDKLKNTGAQQMLARRDLLANLIVLAAPAIVRTHNLLMPIKSPKLIWSQLELGKYPTFPIETVPKDGTPVKLYGPYIDGEVVSQTKPAKDISNIPLESFVVTVSNLDKGAWVSNKGILVAEFTGWLPA